MEKTFSDCACKTPGSESQECDGDGACSCYNEYTGDKCDQCNEGYECKDSATDTVLDCTSCVNDASICNANAYCELIPGQTAPPPPPVDVDVIDIGGDNGIATAETQVTLLEVDPSGTYISKASQSKAIV